MNVPPQPPVTVEVDTTAARDWTWYIFNTAWGAIPIVFALLFSGGAAYLSYQRNQSMGWAIVAFFFATIYYPYYAFVLSGTSSSTPLAPAIMAAGKRAIRTMAGKKH